MLALPAGMPISLGRHLTEPVAWAAVLAGLWYARRERWAPAAAALTVAVLARERAANEGLGLSVLVALADRGSRPSAGRWALLLAAAMTAGVALEYAVRQ